MKPIVGILVVISLFTLTACDPASQKTEGTSNDSTKVDSVAVAPAPVTPMFNSPESAISDGEFLYVANVGMKLEPTVKDGDGRIMKLTMATDNWLDKDKWATIKLNAPKGMAILGRTLYVTDIDRIVAIDLDNVVQTAEYDLLTGLKAGETPIKLDPKKDETPFLNDLCVKNDSTLLVSAMGLNAIYQLNLNEKNFSKMKTGELNSPNGLVYNSEDNKVYCVEFGEGNKNNGRVLAIDGNTGAIKQLSKYTGGLDGVALGADGSVIFSDWAKAHVEKLDIPKGIVTEVNSDSIQGPADFYYNSATQKLYLPRMMENKFTVLEGI
jgi:DNA-binding beta-propeller fold protein YncE